MGVDSVRHRTAAKQEGERPANVIADWHAERWESMRLFDWFVTFSFDEKTNRRYGLNRPDKLHDFVEQKLRDFGYWGPFVIVAHDNSKSHYYHAHCLLTDYEKGLCAQLTVNFRPYGNVSNADDGPIQGSGAYRYCANRAFPHKDADLLSKESLRFSRRPRPRGTSRGKGLSVNAESQTTKVRCSR